MEDEKFEEEIAEVDVLVTLKSSKTGLADEEIMSVPSWLSSSQFSARVATVFRSLISKEGSKFLIMRKFQEKFGQFVTLKKGVENFLEDRAKFEAVIYASTQDLNLAVAYDIEEELGLTGDGIVREIESQVKPKSFDNSASQQPVDGAKDAVPAPFTCLSSVAGGPLPPAVSKSKIPSLLRYDLTKAASQKHAARFLPPPMSSYNRLPHAEKIFSLSFPSPPKNSAFAKEVVSVPPIFGRGSRRGGPRRRSPMPAGRWRKNSPAHRRYNRSRSRSLTPPSRKFYKRYARSRSRHLVEVVDLPAPHLNIVVVIVKKEVIHLVDRLSLQLAVFALLVLARRSMNWIEVVQGTCNFMSNSQKKIFYHYRSHCRVYLIRQDMQPALISRSVRQFCSHKLASTSKSFNQPALPEEQTKVPAKGIKETLARFLPNNIFDSIDEHRPKSAATTLGFENKQGLDGYDPDVPLETLRKKALPVFKQQTSKLMGEVSQMLKPNFEKPEIYKFIRGLRQDETLIHMTLNRNIAWKSGKQVVTRIGGKVTRSVNCSGQKMVVQFSKDGKTERAGWCGMKTCDRHAYNRRIQYKEWEHFSHLVIKCRGDGRRYKVMLHSPGIQDVTWFDSHTYPLHTHGVRDRIQDEQFVVPRHQVSAVGITLSDRINGDFKLEVDFIGAYHDTSHTEKFAYEMFQLPLLSTKGF
uniref:NADH:ubiquinone oxidoreductase intermediate-associated protein 30 domain-containing protein n=1 Tax=Ditylenchus dipsaci TaxID=166011 RepID=A0A915D6J1_9BILA